jgi:hypothetical protein
MASNYKVTYSVDIVFCIDATMSMDPILDTVKANALHFYQDFQKLMEEKRKTVHQLRVKVIAFRDYHYDKEKAMLVSRFLTLPGQSADFEAGIRSIEAFGGGDDPEDGLEALAYAMKSDWSYEGQKHRHVIVVWSDDGTHDLGFGKDAPNYPKGMPKDFNELTEWWGSRTNPGIMDNNSKRLVLFTPSFDSWTKIRENWNNVIHFESAAGKGLQDYNYEEILNLISNTI